MTGILRRNDYAFVDKHPIVDELRTAIQESGEPIEYIAQSAGVCRATIDSMLSGKTRKPYSTTLDAIARALGKHLTLADGVLRLAAEAPPPAPRPWSPRHVVQMNKYRRYR